jgi:starch phosphorylase
MRLKTVPTEAPPLPEPLAPLWDLAFDLRWTWRPSARSIFRAIDPDLHRAVRGNPILILRHASRDALLRAAEDTAFLGQLRAVRAERGLDEQALPHHPGVVELAERGEKIAYFCAEFGLTELLPIYAGGLGVLAGDHLKSASDWRLPLSGVGLLYREGYFRQFLGPDGRQGEANPVLDLREVPMRRAATPQGLPAKISLPLDGRVVHAAVWAVEVGRVPLLLLDADVEENAPEDRALTARLYSGDGDMRIRQEILLGIGGLRALEAVGLKPTIRHLNEGHAAFVALEKIRELVTQEGFTFEEARELAEAGNVFTTHTPVPAGIDLFGADLVARYLEPYIGEIGIAMEEFLQLGRERSKDPTEPFSMPAFALRISGHANAVSRLHARVSRRLWSSLLPELGDKGMHIRPITNGVHRPTWTDPDVAAFPLLDSPETIDREAFWGCHERLRARLIETCRERLVEHARALSPTADLEAASRVLDPRALTIGFARRFATYKRATLLLKDPARLARLVSDPARPVQFVFAGKAHPRDESGKDFLRAIQEASGTSELAGRFVFVPDYDMFLARRLTAGCDVWLNTPIRPHEASGTSGMKAAMNGVLNCSVLDGWWDEAPQQETGFVIGGDDDEAPDDAIVASLYDLLEKVVVPLFWDRDESGVPREWVERMLSAARLLGRQFSSDRMVGEYLELGYRPASAQRQAVRAKARGTAERPV